LEEKGQWGDHEIDGKMSYRGMQPTCSGFETGRLQQEIRKKDGEAMARKRAEAPKKKKNKGSEGLQ
jgi:hypothetical protein